MPVSEHSVSCVHVVQSCVVSGTHTSIVRDREDALMWRYLGTADQAGVHEWQWEYEGVVIQYGRFRVMGTGFSE